jgi:hypothetical protein
MVEQFSDLCKKYVDGVWFVKQFCSMNSSQLSPDEAAELEFLRWLDASLAGFCGETNDFRARAIAAKFGARNLTRLRGLEEIARAAAQFEGVPEAEPLARAASQTGGGR